MDTTNDRAQRQLLQKIACSSSKYDGPTRLRSNDNLNPATSVFVPGIIPTEPVATPGGLPVLVWIHGGGYASHPYIPEIVSELDV